MKIPPTVGRIVWFYENADHYESKQPYAGMICYVHSDTCVNVKYVEADTGGSQYAFSCPLVHEFDDTQPLPAGPFCTWMPYQLGQAARTTEAERALIASKGTDEQPVVEPRTPPL